MNCDSGVLTRQMPSQYPSDEKKDGNTSLFQLCIPAHLSYVGVARGAVDALAEQLDLSADDRSALKLAVGEACNNAVQYGNFEEVLGSDPRKQNRRRDIGVSCHLLPDAIEIDVRSEGTDFEPVPGEHTMPAPESMAESGRGLALIELMMDSVEYLKVNGGHIVRMRKRLASPNTNDQ